MASHFLISYIFHLQHFSNNNSIINNLILNHPWIILYFYYLFAQVQKPVQTHTHAHKKDNNLLSLFLHYYISRTLDMFSFLKNRTWSQLWIRNYNCKTVKTFLWLYDIKKVELINRCVKQRIVQYIIAYLF